MKKITEQQIAKRKKYQKTSGENRKKKRAALREAAKTAGAVILEPIMAVDIVAPEDNLGDVMGHVSARRGMIEGQESRGPVLAVKAKVPLSEMFGYATTLRSATQGRGTFQMVFDHYEAVPKNIQEEIIKNSGKED